MKKFLANVILTYIRFWSRIAVKRAHPTIIGIAGTVGKSSTRNAVYAAIKDHVKAKVISGNSETGIPLGLVGLEPTSYSPVDWLRLVLQMPFRLSFLKNTKYAIVEMGIDDPYPPKNMEYLLTIVKPDIAISLNVSAAHTMQFDKVLPTDADMWPEEKKREFLLQKIAEEDTKIIRESDCHVGIYNQDDVYITHEIAEFQKSHEQTKLLSFGTHKDNTIVLTDYKVTLQGTTFHYELAGEKIVVTLSDYVLPQGYQEVIATALLVAQQIGITPKDAIASLQKNLTLPKGRASLFAGIHDSILLDSSYNSSKAAVSTFLELIAQLKKQEKRPVVFLMGDMRELGEEAQIEHEEVVQKMVGIVDYLYCVGALTRQYVLPEADKFYEKFTEIRWFDSSIRAGEYLQEHLPEHALVLIKGSQNTIFLEEAVKYILKNKKDAEKLCRQETYWMDRK